MSTTIKLKSSGITGNVPSNSELEFGEVALNYADGILYFKDASNVVTQISGAAANTFETINANGTLLIADSNNDILTIAAGDGIDITGNSSDDSLTINVRFDDTVTSSSTDVAATANAVRVAYEAAINAYNEGIAAYAAAEDGANTVQVLKNNSLVLSKANLNFKDTGTVNVAATSGTGQVNLEFTVNTTGSGIVAAQSTAEAAYAKANAPITIKEIYASNNGVVNTFANINTIQFDADSGMAVVDEGNNAVTIQLNSTFKTWNINGGPGLVAFGLDTVNFVSANGITLSANNLSSPKTFTIDATELPNAYAQANAAYAQANLAALAGANNQVLYRNSSNVITGSNGLQYDGVSLKVNGNLESVYQNGDEGGEIYLNKPVTNTNIVNGVTIDIYQDKIRFFEAGGNNRGAFIDITATTSGVGRDLLAGGPQGPQGYQGVQGDVGPQGLTGPQGPQGVQGDVGSQGYQGFQGEIGAQGAQGHQGFQGEIGAQGFQGYQGVQGHQGFQGETGPQGYQGFQGETGPQGPQGFQGVIGPQGYQGFQGDIGPQGYQGFQGETGPQGSQGVQGEIGAQGYQGFQGEIGSQGHQGHQGFQGEIGSQGYQGFQGEIGPQGPQGVQGHQGVQGDIGPQGYQGFQGAVGAQGPQGVQGSLGPQGPAGQFGGASFYYKFDTETFVENILDGYVLLTNTNLSQANVMGISVVDRANSNIASFIQTIDDSTSDIKGTIKITEEANTLNFVFYAITATHIDHGNHFDVPVSYTSGTTTPFSNNSNVVVTFSVTGDKGDTGPQGPQGVQGATGSQGFQGVVGAQGATGPQGPQGYQGVQGDVGPQGFQGLTGAQGAAGVQGAQGEVGPQGFQGVQGATGPQGPQGVQGATGPQGVQGAVGAQGATGPQGFQGVIGAQGATGPQGVQGETGPQGPQGIQGATGPQGPQGIQGAVGAQGAQGVVGAQGVQGATGPQGPQGVQGAVGAQGVQGAPGVNPGGTANYLAKFTGATTIANSILYDDGTNVGVGTTTAAYKLEVNGSFAATTKSFVIDHPTKPGMKLRYGSLEGPENGIYVRGILQGRNIIELPEYWIKLIDYNSITVSLTPIGKYQKLFVENIEDNKVYVSNGTKQPVNCFYIVLAERSDVEKLVSEY